MEPSITIETLITKVLDEISQKGFSSIQPFSIGKIEERMAEFAKINDIILGGDELYMSAKQLRHSLRASILFILMVSLSLLCIPITK